MKKLNLTFVILAFFLSANSSSSQVTEEWVMRYNGPMNGYDIAHAIAVDGAGNVYVTGASGEITTGLDYLTIKYNSQGIEQWSARYNGPANYHDQAYSIAVDDSGNVYVTGGSFGIGTERDYATIKYNSNGDMIWLSRYNGPGNGLDEAKRLVIDKAGYIYVTGFSDGAGPDLDYLTIKYNSDGVIQWTARYNGPSAPGKFSEDRPHSLTLDENGNVYVTGQNDTGEGNLSFYATVKYNSSGVQQWASRYQAGGNLGINHGRDIVVDESGNVFVTGTSSFSPFNLNPDVATIKYNPSGDSVWVNRFNGPGNSSDVGNRIVLDREGNIIVAGLTVPASLADICVIKYNQFGDIVWLTTYDGPGAHVDVATSLVLDEFDNIYVSGFSTGIGTSRDYVTIKYNPSGVEQWVQRYNGPGNGDDEVTAMVIDPSGNIYITGHSVGSGTGYSDYATIKYSQETIGVEGITSTPIEFLLNQNYPNPFNPVTSISFSIPKTADTKLAVYDILGREIITLLDREMKQGTYKYDFDASNLSSGVYFYRLISGDFFETKKMTLTK